MATDKSSTVISAMALLVVHGGRNEQRLPCINWPLVLATPPSSPCCSSAALKL